MNLEVQGIVSSKTGEPLVQLRQNQNGRPPVEFQVSPGDARQIAQQLQEAATNAVYDAAIWLWAKETWPNDPEMGGRMLQLIREHRADAWGLPDTPEDWRP